MTKYILRVCNRIAVTLIISILPMLNGCVSDGVVRGNKIDGPFKNYDTAIRDSIMHDWGALLKKDKPKQIGKVVLEFHLNCDGSISDMKTLEDSVGGRQAVICQKAVLASAPFPRWPDDMSRMLGVKYRIMRFTFSYY
jgi:hypothetical protein